jgi:hypothetical protein
MNKGRFYMQKHNNPGVREAAPGPNQEGTAGDTGQVPHAWVARERRLLNE